MELLLNNTLVHSLYCPVNVLLGSFKLITTSVLDLFVKADLSCVNCLPADILFLSLPRILRKKIY